jgi:hypothetical protein
MFRNIFPIVIKKRIPQKDKESTRPNSIPISNSSSSSSVPISNPVLESNLKIDTENYDFENGIFISIPSFRDPQIVETVQDALQKAKFPSRLFFGICEQNMPGKDPSCLTSKSLQEFVTDKKQIFVDSINFTEARGPCYARERIETILLPLAKNSAIEKGMQIKYILCIDAHTLFQKNWDEILQVEFEKEFKNENKRNKRINNKGGSGTYGCRN